MEADFEIAGAFAGNPVLLRRRLEVDGQAIECLLERILDIGAGRLRKILLLVIQDRELAHIGLLLGLLPGFLSLGSVIGIELRACRGEVRAILLAVEPDHAHLVDWSGSIFQNVLADVFPVQCVGNRDTEVLVAEPFLRRIHHEVVIEVARFLLEALIVLVLVHELARQLDIVHRAVLVCHDCLLGIGDHLQVHDIDIDIRCIPVVRILRQGDGIARRIVLGQRIGPAVQHVILGQSEIAALLFTELLLHWRPGREGKKIEEERHRMLEGDLDRLVVCRLGSELADILLASKDILIVLQCSHLDLILEIGSAILGKRIALPGIHEVICRDCIPIAPLGAVTDVEPVGHLVIRYLIGIAEAIDRLVLYVLHEEAFAAVRDDAHRD